MAKITIFRPDGQKVYDNINVTSIEGGAVMFVIPSGTSQFQTETITTNLPFFIEGHPQADTDPERE